MTFDVDRKRVVVVGGGRSGRAAAELLVSRGAEVVLSDTGHSVEDADNLRRRGVTFELGPHRADLFKSADLIVVSPGVPLEQDAFTAARAAGVAVIGEVELASRWLSGRVIAITGTKGKSTTTTLADGARARTWRSRRRLSVPCRKWSKMLETTSRARSIPAWRRVSALLMSP